MKTSNGRLSRIPLGIMTAALLGALVLAGAGRSALAAADDFYRSKQVRVSIGFSAGGGFDAYGRLLARHIGKHIPGNPSVIAVNFPGAGSLRLANYIYNKAPKDGLSIGTFAGTLVAESTGKNAKLTKDSLKPALWATLGRAGGTAAKLVITLSSLILLLAIPILRGLLNT